MKNTAARKSLETWFVTKEPGYAVLVSGPWGCGKSHIVKRELSRLGEDVARYVSLCGVTSREDIEAAIVRANYPASDAQAA